MTKDKHHTLYADQDGKKVVWILFASEHNVGYTQIFPYRRNAVWRVDAKDKFKAKFPLKVKKRVGETDTFNVVSSALGPYTNKKGSRLVLAVRADKEFVGYWVVGAGTPTPQLCIDTTENFSTAYPYKVVGCDVAG